jgi:hypothetical protein
MWGRRNALLRNGIASSNTGGSVSGAGTGWSWSISAVGLPRCTGRRHTVARGAKLANRPVKPRPLVSESGRSSGVQERDDRTDPTVVVVRFVQVQFGENAADMLFDGALGNPQSPCDAGI